MALGYANVDAMLREITSEQFNEWIAFYGLEPFGFQADLYGHAITASTVFNVNRGKKTKALMPEDFLPKEREEGTAQDFISGLKRFFGRKDANQSTPHQT